MSIGYYILAINVLNGVCKRLLSVGGHYGLESIMIFKLGTFIGTFFNVSNGDQTKFCIATFVEYNRV